MKLPAVGLDASVFLLCHAKYAVGVALAMASRPPLAGLLASTAGAFSGTLLWVFAGDALRRGYRRIRGPHRARRRFHWRSRLLVRLRRRKALAVIALLTPVLLSMPLGCALALSLEPRRGRVIFSVWAAVLFWGVLLFGLRAAVATSPLWPSAVERLLAGPAGAPHAP